MTTAAAVPFPTTEMQVQVSRYLPYESQDADGTRRWVHAVLVSGVLVVSQRAFDALKSGLAQ